MSIFLFANNASTTLAGGISNVSTTASLAAGTGVLFPNPGANQYFAMTFTDAATGLNNEIVYVTARSGDVITMTRAQEGTSAQNWLANDLAANLWTAGSAQSMLQQGQYQQQSANYAVDSGGVNAMVVTLSPAPSALSGLVGAPIRVLVGHTNTSRTVTLTANGLTAMTVVNPDGSTPAIGQIKIGQIAEFVWDGTNAQLISASYLPGVPGTGIYPATGTGYVKIPNSGGLILQWGSGTTSTGAGDTVAYPTAFSSVVLTILAGEGHGAGIGWASNKVSIYATSPGATPLTSFLIYSAGIVGTSGPVETGGVTFNWFAIGI